jgi:hypothetical protein
MLSMILWDVAERFFVRQPFPLSPPWRLLTLPYSPSAALSFPSISPSDASRRKFHLILRESVFVAEVTWVMVLLLSPIRMYAEVDLGHSVALSGRLVRFYSQTLFEGKRRPSCLLPVRIVILCVITIDIVSYMLPM